MARVTRRVSSKRCCDCCPFEYARHACQPVAAAPVPLPAAARPAAAAGHPLEPDVVPRQPAQLGVDLRRAGGGCGALRKRRRDGAVVGEEVEEPLADHELKVMRRIDHRAIAVEAVLTRHGTLVGR